jgi:HSP20 family protein
MSTLMRWDPFREMTTLRDEMNRLFTRTIGDQPVAKAAAEATWSPPVDVFDTPDAIVLKAELPGLKVEDVDVELDEHVLTISGERRFEEKADDGRAYRLERAYGRFARTMTLPQNVKADEIAATITDGVLEVRVPKADEIRPRKIAVSAATG